MRVTISGIAGVTPPESASQERALHVLAKTAGLGADSLRFARAIFERSGIDRRASVLGSDAGAMGFYASSIAPGTAARMALYAHHAAPLAERACLAALQRAECPPGAITHVVTASCTGFNAPGIDIELVERLGLRPDVRRAHIGFMGCHAAINALGVAGAIVRAGEHRGGGGQSPPRVLVACVELSSLHLQPSNRPDHIVAGALFADGAAACVVSGASDDESPAPSPKLELLDTGSTIIPGSRDAMGWSIGDHGFAMTLAESVPGLVREHLRPWLAPWLARTPRGGTSPTDVAWCVHPGGPRILDAVRDALGLDDAALRFSRDVLRDHGNMSSATVLFILERMLRAGNRGPVVMLAFGPGLCIEAALVFAR